MVVTASGSKTIDNFFVYNSYVRIGIGYSSTNTKYKIYQDGTHKDDINGGNSDTSSNVLFSYNSDVLIAYVPRWGQYFSCRRHIFPWPAEGTRGVEQRQYE